MSQTMKTTHGQDGKHDDGFTLIELMVVVMIIAVLLAIAIPTFLGSQNKAKDRSAQSALRNSVTTAKTIYADSIDYSKADITALKAAEPSLTFVVAATASTAAKTVSVSPGTSPSTVFYAAAKSASGTCFYIKDDIGAGTTYIKGSSAATCSGTAAAALLTYSATGWS